MANRPRNAIRVKFSLGIEGTPVRIGGHGYGDVYIGRMRFRDGKWKRVAIKVFREQLSYEKASSYRACIARLLKAGVRLPKMGLVKMKTQRAPDGEFVQVSQLFGSTSMGSKMTNKADGNFKTGKARLEAVAELTKVANAGYMPETDLIEEFSGGKGAIPIDLDTIVKYRSKFGPAKIDDISNSLVKVIEDIGGTVEADEYKALYEIAFKFASPALRENLKKYSPLF